MKKVRSLLLSTITASSDDLEEMASSVASAMFEVNRAAKADEEVAEANKALDVAQSKLDLAVKKRNAGIAGAAEYLEAMFGYNTKAAYPNLFKLYSALPRLEGDALESVSVETLSESLAAFQEAIKDEQDGLQRAEEEQEASDNTDTDFDDENDTPAVRKAKRVVQALGIEAEEYEGYSGRGMYGDASPYAFTTSTHPNSQAGKDLRKRGGFTFDNMGRDFIYYLR